MESSAGGSLVPPRPMGHWHLGKAFCCHTCLSRADGSLHHPTLVRLAMISRPLDEQQTFSAPYTYFGTLARAIGDGWSVGSFLKSGDSYMLLLRRFRIASVGFWMYSESAWFDLL